MVKPEELTAEMQLALVAMSIAAGLMLRGGIDAGFTEAQLQAAAYLKKHTAVASALLGNKEKVLH